MSWVRPPHWPLTFFSRLKASLTFKCMTEHLFADFFYSIAPDTYLWKQMMQMNRKLIHIWYNQGAWTLSMISNRSVKMTSDYPTSCLEVRRKQKVNKPIFKGCPRKIICKYQYFNHIVFSSSACLQKENCLSDNYLLLSDMPFIKHEACTKVNLHCTMPLFPITKMVKLLLLSHDHVCKIMYIKRYTWQEIAKQACV